MKKNIKIYLLFVVLLSLAIIIRTYAYFNNSIQSEVNTFRAGEWNPAKSSIKLVNGQNVYSNIENVSSYVDQDADHYKIKIVEDNQFLSFQYKIETQESAELFDNPVLNLRINDQLILQIDNPDNNIWNQAYIDLSNYELELGDYDLIFEVLNTYDDQFIAEYQIRELTTKKLYSKTSQKLLFSTSKQVGSFYVEHYKSDGTSDDLKQVELYSVNQKEYEYIIPDNFSNTYLSFWSVDQYGNEELKNNIYLNIHKEIGVANFNYILNKETKNELSAQLSFNNLSNNPKYLLTKVSDIEIQTEEDWNQANDLNIKNHHQFKDDKVIRGYKLGIVKSNLVFNDFNYENKYLSIKICNQTKICKYLIKNNLME